MRWPLGKWSSTAVLKGGGGSDCDWPLVLELLVHAAKCRHVTTTAAWAHTLLRTSLRSGADASPPLLFTATPFGASFILLWHAPIALVCSCTAKCLSLAGYTTRTSKDIAAQLSNVMLDTRTGRAQGMQARDALGLANHGASTAAPRREKGGAKLKFEANVISGLIPT